VASSVNKGSIVFNFAKEVCFFESKEKAGNAITAVAPAADFNRFRRLTYGCRSISDNKIKDLNQIIELY
jgi:hypothetical protein